MESIEKHIKSLISLIKREYDLYKHVYELVKQEQTELVNADIEGLENSLREQRTAMNTINKLEKERLQELEVLGIYLGMAPEKIKIATIAQNAPRDLSQELTRLEAKFKSVIEEILKINKSNKFLVNRSLQFLDKNIQIFFGALEENGLYTPEKPGGKSGSKTNRIIDWKA